MKKVKKGAKKREGVASHDVEAPKTPVVVSVPKVALSVSGKITIAEPSKHPVPPPPSPTTTKAPIALAPKPITATPASYVPRPTTSKVTDVRPTSKLLGPMEELSMLTLQDFRRIGTNPTESVLRVETKIERLKKESLTRGKQGIVAWKSSPLYQQYNEIMHESLNRRIGPDALLLEKPSLTIEEFHAIMELNAKLRF